MRGRPVASPAYIAEHGAPETPEELLAHEALMQGNDSWQFLDGDRIVTVRPQGRFKADNGAALLAAAAAGIGIGYLPDALAHDHLASGALVPVMTRYLPPRPAPTSSARRVGTPRGRYGVLTEVLVEFCNPDAPLPGSATVRTWHRGVMTRNSRHANLPYDGSRCPKLPEAVDGYALRREFSDTGRNS